MKNKVAPPFRTAEVDIMYGQGISQEGEIVDLGAEKEVIQKSGAWYSYEGERLGQGRENAKQFLIENPDIKAEIDQKIRVAYGLEGVAEIMEGHDVDDKAEEAELESLMKEDE